MASIYRGDRLLGATTASIRGDVRWADIPDGVLLSDPRDWQSPQPPTPDETVIVADAYAIPAEGYPPRNRLVDALSRYGKCLNPLDLGRLYFALADVSGFERYCKRSGDVQGYAVDD